MFPREVRLESWDKSKKKMNDGGGRGESNNSIGNACYAGYAKFDERDFWTCFESVVKGQVKLFLCLL